MFLEGKDYLSVWKSAHLWAGHDPDSTDSADLPEEVQDNIFRIIQGFMRNDLTLRKKSGARLSEDNPFAFFSGVSAVLKLRKTLIKHTFDKKYLDSVLVERGEVLRWCQKEFRTPPSFWLPEESIASLSSQTVEEEEDDKGGWYKDLTDLRKHRVTCLEIAKQLWVENENLTYEQVYGDPAMNRFQCKRAFNTLDNFKKWTRPFSPSAAKEPGRRK
jgi:hypothetical protein